MVDAVQKWEKPTREELAKLPPVGFAILEVIAPTLFEMTNRIAALEQQLAAKGVGAPPGVAIVDPVVVEYVQTALWRVENDVSEIKRNYLKYAGLYQHGKTYKTNDVITKHGLWVALHPTDSVPGAHDSDWKLIHKDPPRDRERKS